MGVVTPNISIYIPAAGETNYDSSFAAGMMNIDLHDHSGGPTGGVKLQSSGISDGAITYNLLNANVVDTTTGLATYTGSGANQIYLQAILSSLYNNATSAGMLAKSGTTISAYDLASGNTNRITITSGDGSSGAPTFSAPDVPTYLGVNASATYSFEIATVPQMILNAGLLDLSAGGTLNTAISNGNVAHTGGISPSGTAAVTGFIVSPGQMYLALSSVYTSGSGGQISLVGGGALLTDNGTVNALGSTSPTLSMNTSTGQVSITNNAGGSLEFQIAWIRIL